MNKNATSIKNITAQAPAWVYATDPDEGIVYCLCCHAGTDPQDAFERPNQRNHKADCNAVALMGSLQSLMRQTNNIEVLGEWAAEDRNHRSSAKLRAEIDEIKAQARDAITQAAPL